MDCKRTSFVLPTLIIIKSETKLTKPSKLKNRFTFLFLTYDWGKELDRLKV